jgi:hypothetical protein
VPANQRREGHQQAPQHAHQGQGVKKTEDDVQHERFLQASYRAPFIRRHDRNSDQSEENRLHEHSLHRRLPLFNDNDIAAAKAKAAKAEKAPAKAEKAAAKAEKAVAKAGAKAGRSAPDQSGQATTPAPKANNGQGKAKGKDE